MNYGALPITLRQLQYACAVADELSFRRAAERCFVSQPALSAQLAELERMLGVRLFERHSRRVLITAAGETLVAHARGVLLGTDDLLLAARQLVDPLAGMLRLGVIPTIAPYLLPDLDPALRAAWPKLDLQWTEDKTEVLVEAVKAGRLDGALLALEADIGGLAYEPLARDTFVLAVSPEHPLGDEVGPVGLGVLQSERVFLLEDGHCFRDEALDVCAMAGAEEQAFRATSLGTLTQMAAGAGGVTLLPQLAVEVENRRGSLVIRPFRAPTPGRTLAFAWRPGSPVGEALKRLADTARERCEAIFETVSS